MLAATGLLCLLLGAAYGALADRLLFPARLERAKAALKAAVAAADWTPFPISVSKKDEDTLGITLHQKGILPLGGTHRQAWMRIRKAELLTTEEDRTFELKTENVLGTPESGYCDFHLHGLSIPPEIREAELSVDWEIATTVRAGIGLPDVPVSETRRTRIPVDLGNPEP